MSIITILLFFIYTLGLGFSLTFFFKNSSNFFERNIIRSGIGIGIFIVLGVILNFIRIPLDWRIFLILSLIIPMYELFKKIKSKELTFTFEKLKFIKPKFTKSNLNILIVLIIFLFCLKMYSGGAFKYPYLENDDPWSHASSIKYISLEKTVFQPNNYKFEYIDPYPPGYDLLMGVLHQTSPSLSWTLKFFNGLIISLSILFFYFFAKLFINNKNGALFATFVLVAIPSYFTHFIWAHSLVIMLFFPAMYSLEMIKKDKKWIYPSIILIASILFTQPSQAIKLGIMFGIYWGVNAIIHKDWLKNVLIAEVGGLILSIIWWFGKWKDSVTNRLGEASFTNTASFFEKLQSGIFSPGYGTATKAYTFNDFFLAKPFGGINVHLGWGIFVTVLLFFGILYCIFEYKKIFQKKNSWIIITLVWFIFTLLGTNSVTFNLPVGLIAFRFWLILAIPVALLSYLGLRILYSLGSLVKIPKLSILLIIIVGVIMTAGYQKYNHNNLPWLPGVDWSSNQEVEGYVWMKINLEVNTKVFDLCILESDRSHVLGFDKLYIAWDPEVIEFKKDLLNKSPQNINLLLNKFEYEYLVIDSSCIKNFGINNTNLLIQKIENSNLFDVAHQTQGMVLFRTMHI